jgi:hypothetical protein
MESGYGKGRAENCPNYDYYPRDRIASAPRRNRSNLRLPMATIEDMIYQRWDGERAGAAAFSFAPIYQFLSAVAHLARMNERQAIVDLVRETRQQGRGKNWNAGYDAALTAIMRALVERAHTN